MSTIYIGSDIEFMAYHTINAPIYPKLAEADKSAQRLQQFGCDEFGHCVEARPKEAEEKTKFITNIMKSMSLLPFEFIYKSRNTHILPAKKYIELVRAQGQKQVPECNNIYGQDILDDCPLDVEVRQSKQRLLFCGTHFHISEVETVFYQTKDEHGQLKTESVVKPMELPVTSLVYLFDQILFPCFSKDKHFTAGRYRAPGFYEHKVHGGFEYRSLGSSVFTPRRMALLFDGIKYIVEHRDELMNLFMNQSPGTKKVQALLPEPLKLIQARLVNSAAETDNIRRLWVPWEYDK